MFPGTRSAGRRGPPAYFVEPTITAFVLVLLTAGHSWLIFTGFAISIAIGQIGEDFLDLFKGTPEKRLGQALKPRGSVDSLVFIDLDRLRKYNDRFEKDVVTEQYLKRLFQLINKEFPDSVQKRV